MKKIRIIKNLVMIAITSFIAISAIGCVTYKNDSKTDEATKTPAEEL